MLPCTVTFFIAKRYYAYVCSATTYNTKKTKPQGYVNSRFSAHFL